MEVEDIASQLCNPDEALRNSSQVSIHSEASIYSELNIAKIQLYEANQKLAIVESEHKALRKEVTKLSTLLHEKQNFIFSLPPRQQRPTESEAMKEYAAFCGSIETWVELHLGDAIEDRSILTLELPAKS